MNPADFDLQASVSRLFVYPIKSCAGVELQESLLIETGLEFDRAWMVVDEEGEFLSQRELPRMALIRPTLKYSEMVLRAPGMLALHIAFDRVEAPVRVRVWDDEVAAYDMGDIAAQWFSDFLSEPGGRKRKLRLVRFDPEHKRVSSRKWTGEVEALNQFADGFPLLVISEASLAEFNSRMQAAGHGAVGMERFRPNLVLSGIEAHDEDRVDEVRIDTGDGGLVLLRPVKPCARCTIPDVDPATAETGTAVNETLRAYRADPRLDGALTFGMNVVVLEGVEQALRVGQSAGANLRFE
ncbi:MAG: MOSC N-terminal beta barrel domain-containing protein [Proteobacteria bacterium]|nr:MOSC N-terminal beta barrel domain-containing protein [Pseudomonadota bacterium]